ncbi:ABC transporter ATP-binding protein [Actibacterium lipolyticum]|uniref:Aliphatic sulfonates import ATP-binding protein SsuB n=1 Tax=Actibacterium lipolyticum TaxID=1524263 RepID=A0A238L895_9RHOB|nr:ABC transporter ATP-binding protein [Actibacterium lipolyticum]SMX51227.1 Aliphatic sulfonates import ATP-binding protein SsuB [Actibacterium lipolyticum]
MTIAPALHLDGAASFDGVPVFAGVSLDVPAGQWTCLLGSSGVGKSTVLKLFAGLDAGVEFDGALGASDGPLAGQVALMAQDDLLLPWLSVTENVLLGARLRGTRPDHARAQSVLARVGLTDKADRRPGELSGGQRQRVALARTLMEDRPVVLLDEPFSALDARTRAQMQELTAEVLTGRTVLLVTHEPAEAARLGHSIKVMTETGLIDVTPPPGDIPRPVDDPAVLRVQTSLLAQLREDANARD